MTGEMARILEDEILTCTRCRLSSGRTNAVPGEGPVPSRILLIGEAPGEKEDSTGRPFAGRAGRVLDGLLSSIGLSRTDVFITSVLKCRPPENRDPKPDEIALCKPYLDRQIALLRPSVIVPMGRFSASVIMSQFGIPVGKISEIHGTAFPADAPHGRIIIFPVYHPAVITHNPPLRKDLEGDFWRLKEILGTISPL
ncbi:MAG: uracil-DNA glycosylase [Methanomicrobiales archaeon]|nr:uracil-DNA glycosylase [Methanomicrobiales archaeon]